jgi:hypothetical protein
MLKRIFKIDNHFYPSDKIQEVISQFEWFDIKLHSWWELEIITQVENPEEIFDEFMNYLLAYINE